ncbi:MAG: hypothetical protein RL318_615 [Fibrobacterota bacterium]|jgi:hypothetical protein
MPRKPRLSIDQGIKELLQLRPRDALAFLLPDVHAHRGDPIGWEFLATQVRKKDLRGKGFVMDLTIRYLFPEAASLLLVLVEHWSEARSMDLVRTAHYYLDLMERFPGEAIVPVALVTELVPRVVVDRIVGQDQEREYLRFQTRVVQLAKEEATRWIRTRNLVAGTLLLAMRGIEKDLGGLHAMADEFQSGGSEQEIAQLFPLFTAVGRLNEHEEEAIMSYLASMPKPKIQIKIEEAARKEGARAKALEDARKMREHGIEWGIVTDVTGIKPEDLQAD